MEKLAEAYQKQTKHHSRGSGQRLHNRNQQRNRGVCDIGMASRELKDEETEKGVKATEIAKMVSQSS